MFHHRRRSPLADIIDWADYRVGGMPPPHARFGGGFGRGYAHPWARRRQSPLVKLLIGLAILMAVVYLFQRLSGRKTSWI